MCVSAGLLKESLRVFGSGRFVNNFYMNMDFVPLLDPCCETDMLLGCFAPNRVSLSVNFVS